MKDVAVVVLSCDKNEELWPIFKHCLDKYWPSHPNTYLLTETIESPDIKTINIDYPISQWSRRIRESLELVPENKVVFICDDCFLDKPVNVEKLEKCFDMLSLDNTASINFELLVDYRDIECPFEGFKLKSYESAYVVSFLCGIWNKDKLISLLSDKDIDPWTLEVEQNHKNYQYYQTVDDKILSWFRDGSGENAAVRHGRWMHGVEDFLKKENIEVDYQKKGFWSYGFWEKYIELRQQLDHAEDLVARANKKIEEYKQELTDMWNQETSKK